MMTRHTDITKAEWAALVEAIKQPDNSFDLNDLALAVMAKFNVDEKTAKRFVRRWDQQMTITPREIGRLFEMAEMTEQQPKRKGT